VVPVLWMMRNRAADGTLMGPRSSSPDTVGITLGRMIETLGYWVRPQEAAGDDHMVGGILALLVLGLLAIGGLVWAWRRRTVCEAAPADPTPRSLVPLLAFVGSYLVYLVTAQVTTAFDALNSRLMSPVYVPLVVLTAVGLDRVALLMRWRALRIVGGVVLAVVVALNAVVCVRAVRYDRDTGLNAALALFDGSPVVDAVAALPDGDVLFASGPSVLALLSGHQPVRPAPPLTELRTNVPLDVPSSFADTVACTQSWLAELGPTSPDVHPIADLADVVDVTLVQEWPEGRLYRLTPKPGSACG
jgi:hypothetical protein